MKNFLLFFTKKSVLYFIFACLFYLLFLVVGFNVVNYFSPENSKSLENIITISGVIFTGVLAFITEREKEKGTKLYEKKIELFKDFFQKLNTIINDDRITASRKEKEKEVTDEFKDLLFMLAELRVYISHESCEKIISFLNAIISILKSKNNQSEELFDYTGLGKELFSISNVLKEELDILIDNSDTYTLDFKIKGNAGESQLEEMTTQLTEFNKADSADNKNLSEIKKWHVNVGEAPKVKPENQYRCWEDMQTFGFWSAGGAKRYADGVKKLTIGKIIYAYISGQGYVAKGLVDSEPMLIGKFFEQNEIKEKLKTVSIKSKLFKSHLENKTFEEFHNSEIGEYAVKVKWQEPKHGKPFYDSDLKISPLTICVMNSDNLKKLQEEFPDNA